MKKGIAKLLFPFLVLFLFGMKLSAPEEGMYPLSEVHKLDLVKAGLEIDPSEIYNPDGISLIDGLVKIGGCTGSFVSPDGLIITNHHCAFGAINRASTTEKNYLKNGFIAENKDAEIPAFGYTVRIMDSYEDVSEEVLEAAEDIENLADRAKKISEKMREIAAEATDEENSIEARVSEMFIGQTYVLFKYRIIKDVRLVYAPPKSIGNFGGETDNWIWPRHTGDFSFMRAYVAPDGSAADYSEDNVPFHPKKFLKVNPNGVHEGDFTFILGYPGRTYRHRPSQFLEYRQQHHLPYIAGLYQWMIDQLEDISKDDPALRLQVESYMKGLANVAKNYRGKMLGLNRINLVEKKKKEEEQIKEFIMNNPELKEKYSNLFADIDKVYGRLFKNAEANLWFSRMFRFSTAAYVAGILADYASDLENNIENVDKYLARIDRAFAYYYPELEKRFLYRMFTDALEFEGDVRIKAVDDFFKGGDEDLDIAEFIKNEVMTCKALDKEAVKDIIKNNPEKIMKNDKPFMKFMRALADQKEKIDAMNAEVNGALTKLYPQLTEVKKQYKKTSFIPDANGTLRLTYGYIKGYSPADAIINEPITTLEGVIDKANRGVKEYKIPEKLRKLYEEKDFGRFYDKKVGSVPVGILYNMDTTGGNSGSPILNARGELIGVNFDRAYEATINDYAWNESYSRSIGVDIRYVLWITQKYSGGDYLLEEMGVELN